MNENYFPLTRVLCLCRVWVADRVSSNGTQNNNLLTYDLQGFVNLARLRRAVAAVVAHHPGLHTSFFGDGTNTPRQGVLESPVDCFRHIPAAQEPTSSLDIVRNTQKQLRVRRWRLHHGKAVEIVLVSHTESQHTLLIGYHHIAMDGSAWRTFFRDLHLAYQGVALPVPGKSLTAVATEEADNVLDGSSKFWKGYLTPAPGPFPLLSFASAKLRPPMDGFTNRTSIAPIDGSIVDRINSTSRSFGVTSVNFYLAALHLLLSRLAGVEEDICIGVTDSGRNVETAESVGFFLNMLPLRLQAMKSKSFGNLTQQVNNTYREARAHSNVPFDAILESLGINRDPTCPPLFQVGFDIRPGDSGEIPLGNCQLKIQQSDDSELPYDITLCVVPMPTSGPSYVQVISRSDLYSQEATELLAQMYIALLGSVAHPSAAEAPLESISVYPAAEVQKALDFGARKIKKFTGWPSTITERVDNVFRIHADTVAIEDVSGPMRYAELSEASVFLALRLLPYQGCRIAVICEPQREWIIGMLATLRVGAAFVSLDATLPISRLSTMIQACEPNVILCHAATMSMVSEVVAESRTTAKILTFEDTPVDTGGDVQNLEDPSKASFVICTSGTTGIPKAILLSSRGFINYLANQAELHGVQKGEVILQQSNLGFDMAIAEALLSLTHGGTLVIAPQTSRGDPVAITDLMVQEDVSFTFATPTEYLMWLRYCKDTISRLKRWRLAQCGGDKVPDTLYREMQNAGCSPIPVLSDAYGPAEVSICATIQHNEAHLPNDPLTIGTPSIGRTLDNVGIYLLDAQGHVCPPGVPGEICITGVGIALGYVDSDATAKAFTEDFQVDCGNGTKLSEGRMYKTGDLGVWRADGTLGFLGRMSDSTMVKIRGIRVDLSDIENAILSQGSHIISDAIVTLYAQDDNTYLVAHVVPVRSSAAPARENEGQSVEAPFEDLMHRLALPRHMKPARVVVLANMPLSANGKVDRRALSRSALPPREPNTQNHSDGETISTLTQVELHLLWVVVLNRKDLPRRKDIDFWAMGGSSLDLVKLQAAIRKEMLVKVSIRDMFMHSTLESMADLIQSQTSGSPSSKPIDWGHETTLTDDLEAIIRSPVTISKTSQGSGVSGEILLTGADGFLGGHVLRALLENPSIRRIHCIAVSSTSKLPADTDLKRVVVYEGSSIHQENYGLAEEIIEDLISTVDRVILAGSHGHCLNNYASLRQTNVEKTKLLATWASRRRVPLHFISSSRVTLLPSDSQACLPPISVKDHQPITDGSEGLTASKWAGEVFLERLAAAAEKSGSGCPITIHRPCALIGAEAPSDDSLNAILKYSALMSAVPQISTSPVSGYFDFAAVETVAADIADVAVAADQPQHLRFRHHSSGVKVEPSGFKEYMEKMHGKEFVELELEEWLERALKVGIEPMIAVYLRAVVQTGEKLVFPYMGTTGRVDE